MDKVRLRQQMKGQREALSAAERERLSLAAAQRLLDVLREKGCRTVAFYSPIRGEIDPGYAATAFAAAGGKALYPRVESDGMVMTDGDMKVGAFGIKEPVGQAYAGGIDAVIVPLLAVDGAGNRLGWGKGYYDRYFAASNCYKIGFCYDFQMVERICADEWDTPLNCIVTPSKTVNVKRKL